MSCSTAAVSKNRRKQELKRKKVRKTKKVRKSQVEASGEDEYARGGGVMQSMVRGMRSAVGVQDDKKKKSSLLGNIIWLVILGAAAGYLVYRYTN